MARILHYSLFDIGETVPQLVKMVDNILLVTEKRDLMEKEPADWGISEQPLDITIHPLKDKHTEKIFIDRFESLIREYCKCD